MNHVVEATETFGMNCVQGECEFSYNYGPGTGDPDCDALCMAADW